MVKKCKHEWRQKFIADRVLGSIHEDGYYCIFCLLEVPDNDLNEHNL